MSKQPMGLINFGWGSTTVLLPLEEAHKIQTILAKHAISVERAYDNESNSVPYLAEYSTPEVQVYKDRVEWDTRGLTHKQTRRWVEAVKEMPANGTIIDPHSFAVIHGEDNE